MEIKALWLISNCDIGFGSELPECCYEVYLEVKTKFLFFRRSQMLNLMSFGTHDEALDMLREMKKNSFLDVPLKSGHVDRSDWTVVEIENPVI